MERDENKQRVKVGGFVLLGVALFVVATIFVGSASNLFARTFLVSAKFKNVEGLKEGDKVWLSGVQIGTVRRVQILAVGEVVVTLSLKEKQNDFIRRNETASIGSDGLIGNKIVVIQPGNSNVGIEDGDTINAVSPADTQELINLAKQVGENTRTVTIDLKAITSKLSRGEGILGELLNNGEFAREIRTTMHQFNISGQHAAAASSELVLLVHDIRYGEGVLPALIRDTTIKRTFSATMTSLKKVGKSADTLAGSVNAITTKLNRADNPLGVMLQDSASAHKLQSTILHAESAAHKLDENMEALKHNFLTRGYFRRKAKQDKRDSISRRKNGNP
jgi:phospholipid/cholesterol/gamma-HCH transport system substrate-binding protein